MALVAYRNLMRAARIAFQGMSAVAKYPLRLSIPCHMLTHSTGDAPVLAAAQQQIRHEFRQRSSLNSSDTSTQEAVQHAQEVASFLRANVVQGKKVAEGDNMYRELRLISTLHEKPCRFVNNNIRASNSRTHRKRRQRKYKGGRQRDDGRWMLRRRRPIKYDTCAIEIDMYMYNSV